MLDLRTHRASPAADRQSKFLNKRNRAGVRNAECMQLKCSEDPDAKGGQNPRCCCSRADETESSKEFGSCGMNRHLPIGPLTAAQAKQSLTLLP